MWLAYMRYTARTLVRQNCVTCGHARPGLATHPFALGEGEGWQCILEEFYHSLPNTTLCKALSLIFPEVPPQKAPAGVQAYGGNYSCITGTDKGVNYGRLPPGDCAVNVTMNSTWPVEGKTQTKGVADVWWICGPNRKLTPILKGDWQGTCAFASLIVPLTIIDVSSYQLLGIAQLAPDRERMRRGRRSAPWSAGEEIHSNLLGVPVYFKSLLLLSSNSRRDVGHISVVVSRGRSQTSHTTQRAGDSSICHSFACWYLSFDRGADSQLI
ncbi:unnamed protein product [Coregonus sp. 'balchen']|nr:unnamed protein product [Coregonus sp. 'balchen']